MLCSKETCCNWMRGLEPLARLACENSTFLPLLRRGLRLGMLGRVGAMAGGGDAEAKGANNNPGASATPNGKAKDAAVGRAPQPENIGY